MLTDEELLTFDQQLDHWQRLHEWNKASATEMLNRMPELYRNHLIIAKMIDGWVATFKQGLMLSDDARDGIVLELRQISAYLRQGDLLPGGVLYDEAVNKTHG
jgi:hypothetical protein